MIVRKFIQWAQTASATARSEGASALARAYLYADLDAEQSAEAELALTTLLDDASPLVRRALAECFASAADAPHHIILALADDQSDISSIVLGRSPLLTDAELIDCAAIGDAFAQSAIALRPRLSAPVAAALAEVGSREALISLAVNPGAALPVFSMHRMIERYGEDGELREALLSRPNLPAALRSDLVAATSKALLAFVTSCDWMPVERAERATREAREKANVIIAIASEAEDNGPRKLVAHLQGSGQLTAGLVLRALLSGNTSLFEAALCELSGLPMPRVKGLAGDWMSAGFAALYRKAGLPDRLLPVFRAVLDASRSCGHDAPESARLSRHMVERVLTACENTPAVFEDRLFSVLRRFEAEAAREEARLDLFGFEKDASEAEGLSGGEDFQRGLVAHQSLASESFEPLSVAPKVAVFDKKLEVNLEFKGAELVVATDAEEPIETMAPPVELMIETPVRSFDLTLALDAARMERAHSQSTPIKIEEAGGVESLEVEALIAAELRSSSFARVTGHRPSVPEALGASTEALPPIDNALEPVDVVSHSAEGARSAQASRYPAKDLQESRPPLLRDRGIKPLDSFGLDEAPVLETGKKEAEAAEIKRPARDALVVKPSIAKPLAASPPAASPPAAKPVVDGPISGRSIPANQEAKKQEVAKSNTYLRFKVDLDAFEAQLLAA